MKEEIRTIYIFRPGALGDTLIAAPLFYSIRQKFEKERIVLISEQGKKSSHVSARAVAQLIPEINDVLLYPQTSFLEKIKFLKQNIKIKKSDSLLYLNYASCTNLHVARDFLFFKFLGFKKTFGFLEYITTRSKSKINNVPEFQRLFNVAQKLLEGNQVPVDFILKNYRNGSQNIHENEIFCAPFGKVLSKRWSVKKFTELFTRLHNQGVQINVCGSMDEEEEFRKLSWEADFGVKGFFGLPLEELIEKIRFSKLYIGNDTGPMHLAALLGIKCIAIFSDINRDANWIPYGNNHIILRNYVACGNCHTEICPLDVQICLESISVDTVFNEISKKMDIYK